MNKACNGTSKEVNFQKGENQSQLSEEKTKESYFWQTEYRTFRGNLAKKFKPKKRKMGNLILASRIETNQELTTMECGSIDYDSEKPTFATTVSGMFSKFFCSRNTSKAGPDEFESNTERKFIPGISNNDQRRKGLSRLFTSYTENSNINEGMGQIYNERNDQDFNRFSKLEEILATKDEEEDEKSPEAKTSSESNSYCENATGAKNAKDNDKHSKAENREGIEGQELNRIQKEEMNGNSPNSETEKLENSVFSPYTHRPSLQDIPGIDNTQVDPFPIWGYYLYGLFGKGRKSKTSKKSGDHISPVDNNDTNKFNSLDEEINSHLNSQSRISLIPRLFDRHKYTQEDKTQSEIELQTGEISPKIQSPAVLSPPNNLTESFSNLKGILKHKYKSNFSREKYKKENICVRFVSPTLSPIEMTNNEEIDCEIQECKNVQVD